MCRKCEIAQEIDDISDSMAARRKLVYDYSRRGRSDLAQRMIAELVESEKAVGDLLTELGKLSQSQSRMN